jgi:hypothetical protein
MLRAMPAATIPGSKNAEPTIIILME